jgi:peptidoglycan/xylan/chitin deacetylase (PgdA/CDA1 family)
MGDVLVLCYHAVSARWKAPLSVTPAALESQLRRLLARGYRGATFAEALSKRRRSKVLAVTFDDAYRSVGDVAFPLLDRLGIPATVFVPTGFVDIDAAMRWPGIDEWIGTADEAELLPMSWQQLRRLVEAGWEIGSHTVSHPRLTALPDGDLAYELGASRETCEQRTATRCSSIAFPYGDVDRRVVQAARVAGYVHGAALPSPPHRPRPLEWPRVGVYHDDSERRFALKASWTVRMLRAAPSRVRRGAHRHDAEP